MGQFETFAKILEKKIRKEVEAEVMAEVEAFLGKTSGVEESTQPASSCEAWMGVIGNLGRFTVRAEAKAQAYHKLRTPPKPRPAHNLNATQTVAFELFKRLGAGLTSNFAMNDLKAQFRALALKVHPDQGGSSETFQSLMMAYRDLQTVFSK